jgi:hypothetical protein
LILLFVFLLFSLYFYNIEFLPSIERCIWAHVVMKA